MGRNPVSNEKKGRVLFLDKFWGEEGVFGLEFGWMQAVGGVQALELEGSASRGRPL